MNETDPIHSKVKASAAGSVGGVAFAAVVVWLLNELTGLDAGGIEWALAVIFSPVGAFWAGWAQPERAARLD